MSELANRYHEVLGRIEAAAKAAGRLAEEITLVTVTKNHPTSLALELLDLGAKNFGENRDQEAAPKAKEVAQQSQIAPIWHFIGQLQTNKVKSVLEYASFLHSLDRPSLLTELQKRCIGRGESIKVFIQVNLTDDVGRGGIEPEELDGFADQVVKSEGIELVGLMGVAGLATDAARDFERMAGFSKRLQLSHPSASGLSIGMSGDYEVAIGYGATHLRIGTAITGNRSY
ncbi:MAG: YggS family pyridoxal phosphate-dependent enzyme [Actinomycetota bacterium]